MESILTAEHQQQVKHFLDFFSTKRKETLQDIETTSRQFLAQNINDEMFSQQEVSDLFNTITTEVRVIVDGELSNLFYMAGVYVKILMNQAQNAGVALCADVSFIENQRAIEEMRNLEANTGIVRKDTHGGRLPTLQASLNNDPQLYKKLASLKETTADIQGQIENYKEIVEELTGEKNRLITANNRLTEKLEEVLKSNSLQVTDEINQQLYNKEVKTK